MFFSIGFHYNNAMIVLTRHGVFYRVYAGRYTKNGFWANNSYDTSPDLLEDVIYPHQKPFLGNILMQMRMTANRKSIRDFCAVLYKYYYMNADGFTAPVDF
jgi:hypothetical protein